MTNKEIFKIWSPTGKMWVDWVRPVPFVAINRFTKPIQPTNMTVPYISSLDVDKNTAIIIDFPDTQSVEAGIQLAKKGYRPIPIYNGTIEQSGARATTDNKSILGALVWGAIILQNIEIANDAPPAFLTDTNRLQRHKIDCSVFDNSWDVYHQDLPTEEYLLNHNITKIIVISNKLSKDLRKIFNGYPHKKLSIWWTDGYDKMKCIRKGR